MLSGVWNREAEKLYKTVQCECSLISSGQDMCTVHDRLSMSGSKQTCGKPSNLIENTELGKLVPGIQGYVLPTSIGQSRFVQQKSLWSHCLDPSELEAISPIPFPRENLASCEYNKWQFFSYWLFFPLFSWKTQSFYSSSNNPLPEEIFSVSHPI